MPDIDFQTHHELDFNEPSGFGRNRLYGDFEGDNEGEDE